MPNYNPSPAERSLPRPSAAQIEDWVRRNVTGVKRRFSRKMGREMLRINNPAMPHDKEHGYHVAVFPEDGFVKDFRPDMKKFNGGFVRFVALVNNCRWIEAYQEITEQTLSPEQVRKMAAQNLEQLQRPAEEEWEPEEPEMALPKGLKRFRAEGDGIMWNMASAYLLKRQVLLEEAEALQLYYGASALCFTYYEYDELVYWQIRDYLGKYFEFPEGFSGQDFFYRFDEIEPMGDIFITESNFNCIVLGEDVTSAGTAALSPTQVRKLVAKNPRRIVLLPDNDGPGRASLRHNYQALQYAFEKVRDDRVWFALPERQGEDWNDMAQRMNRLEDPGVVRRYVDGIAQPIRKQHLLRF